MISGILFLAIGVLLAWFGGDWFVDGSVGLAKRARWPAAVVGATVAAFGTSSPELMVAIHAAKDGVPQVSFGDVLGSSVVNVALVMALVMVVRGMKAGEDAGGRDWMMALCLPGLVVLLVRDGWFSRGDALVLLAVFATWLTLVIRQARAHAAVQVSTDAMPSHGQGNVWWKVLGGLGLLIIAAQFVVHGGTAVAASLGWSTFIVGAVVVAIATSTPELATTLIATLKGHDDVGMSNILGSNIFNVAFITSVVGLMHPFAVNVPEVLPSLWMGVVTVGLLWSPRRTTLGRWRGLVLLACYATYVVLTVRGS